MNYSEDSPKGEGGAGLREMRIGGTEVHYAALCPRKCWWYTHGLEQEHSGGAGVSAGQENVSHGTLLHETAYPGQRRKDILLDDLLRLDFTEGGQVHEIKKSRGGSRAFHATRMQLLYYLYYLRQEKDIETEGVIDFPKQRRKETVILTDEAEAEVAELLIQVQEIRSARTPPAVAEPMSLCKKCAYQDLCWG